MGTDTEHLGSFASSTLLEWLFLLLVALLVDDDEIHTLAVGTILPALSRSFFTLPANLVQALYR